MPSIGHHIWQQILIYENIWNTDVTVKQQHFQRRYASTELQCIEQLALEIMKEYGFGWE